MNKKEIKASIKYAGAFIAWVVGSGFATGQEILQFFGSYGWKSVAVLAVNLVGFAVLGMIMLSEGYENRETEDFRHYEYYCGKKIGKIYSVIIPVTLVLLMSVLISAAGATLNQYYSVNRYLGSGIMAAFVLAAYLVGFERLVKIVSSVSPFVIIFTVFVGIFTVIKDRSALDAIGNYSSELSQFKTAPHWAISSLLYLSLNFFCGSTYYTALGKSAESRKSARIGALAGSVILLITITVMNFAILLNADGILNVSVPTLYLAAKISGVFGAVFSAVLILGMFSSCSTMMWSFCSGFFRNDRKKNRIFSVAAVIGCMLLGFVPFGSLVSAAYPLIGYSGLIFIGAVIYKGIKRKQSKNKK